MPFILKAVNSYWEGWIARKIGLEASPNVDDDWLEGYAQAAYVVESSGRVPISSYEKMGLLRITFTNLGFDE